MASNSLKSLAQWRLRLRLRLLAHVPALLQRSPLRLRLVKNAKDAKWEVGCIRTAVHPANHGSGALLASKEARLFPVERALGEPSRRAHPANINYWRKHA